MITTTRMFLAAGLVALLASCAAFRDHDHAQDRRIDDLSSRLNSEGVARRRGDDGLSSQLGGVLDRIAEDVVDHKARGESMKTEDWTPHIIGGVTALLAALGVVRVQRGPAKLKTPAEQAAAARLVDQEMRPKA